MKPFPNPYEVLGVAATATRAEITRAFRKLALRHHPDRNPGARVASETAFKELSAAYERIKEPNVRAETDRILAVSAMKERLQEIRRRDRNRAARAPARPGASNETRPAPLVPPGEETFADLAWKSTESLPHNQRIGWTIAGIVADHLFPFK